MFTPLTYAGFLVVFVGIPLAVLLGLTWRRLTSSLVAGTAIVAVVGLLYTTPWDNALIARGVWWYGEGMVLARVYLAPVEEYLFMLLQPVLTVLWLAWLRTRLAAARDSAGSETTPLVRRAWTTVSRRDRLLGAGAGLAVGGLGIGLLTADATFYLGAILAWAGPVLAVQWAFGWTHLWESRRLATLAIGVPTLYLAAADRIAIELGIWVLSAQYTTGVLVGGLPVEEGLFFFVTNVFVVQGVLLFLWVVDHPTPTDTGADTSVASNP